MPLAETRHVALGHLRTRIHDGEIHDGESRTARLRHVAGILQLLGDGTGEGTAQFGELELGFHRRQSRPRLRYTAARDGDVLLACLRHQQLERFFGDFVVGAGLRQVGLAL